MKIIDACLPPVYWWSVLLVNNCSISMALTNHLNHILTKHFFLYIWKDHTVHFVVAKISNNAYRLLLFARLNHRYKNKKTLES